MKKVLYKIIPARLYVLLSVLYHWSFCVLFALVPMRRKIVFSNFDGKGYGDNPKYIAEEIINRKLAYDLVWIVDAVETNRFPTGIRQVKKGALRELYELVTASVWIDNVRKMRYVRKRRGQLYIQTWHGSIAFKRIEKDIERILEPGYVASAKRDSKMADLLISNSSFCTRMYRRAFWYEGKILECGCPRNDLLVNGDENVKATVREHFGVGDRKVVLYAPTFRDNKDMRACQMDYAALEQALQERFGSQWCVLIRFHPAVARESDSIRYSPNVINASDYPDMQELLLASDVLITDYSSSAFDYALMARPVFLYATDVSSYAGARNFYFDYFDLPFAVCESIDQLRGAIRGYNEQAFHEKLSKLWKDVDIKERGTASKDIVAFIEAKTAEGRRGQ